MHQGPVQFIGTPVIEAATIVSRKVFVAVNVMLGMLHVRFLQ